MPYNDVYNLPFPNNLIYDFSYYINQERPCPEGINYTLIKHLLHYTNPRRRKAILYRYENHLPYCEVAKMFPRINHSKGHDAIVKLQEAGLSNPNPIPETISPGAASGLVMGAFRDMIYRYRWEQTAVSSDRDTIADLNIPKKYLNILRDNGVIYIDDAERVFNNPDPAYSPFDVIKNLSRTMLIDMRKELSVYRAYKRYHNAAKKIRENPDFIIELESELRSHGTNHNRLKTADKLHTTM